MTVQVQIGILNNIKEFTLDLDLGERDLSLEIAELAQTPGRLLRLTDVRGQEVMILASAIAYIQIDQPKKRPVGFVS